MPRQKSNAPSYRYHISGQAVVALCAKNFYLGPYDSPESWAKYYALIAEYNPSGKTVPPSLETHLGEAPITVRHVVSEYRELIKGRELEETRFKALLETLETEYGDSPAKEFGPRKLAELRELFVASGNCRRYCNTQTRQIVRVFKHAVSRELIAMDVLLRLQTLEPLRRGQTKAKESKRRMPVALKTVQTTVKHLSPIVAAMVRIQTATGMRPSELLNMRPCDIDRSGETWFYRPKDYKTAGHGISAWGNFVERVCSRRLRRKSNAIRRSQE